MGDNPSCRVQACLYNLTMALPTYGEQISFCEPYWCQGYVSPYYKKTHEDFRALVRNFVETEIKPNINQWLEEGNGYPVSLHEKAYAAGINGCLYPVEYGGTPPEDFDTFHELILWYEFGRAGGGGALGQMSINSMALPPIINAGSQYLKDLVVRDVVTGNKQCSLMISEPGAGSDVAGIQTAATKEGDHYIVNGQKKWITGGAIANFFTCACKTEGGMSLLLLDANFPGIKVRKMKTQFDNTHNTTFVTLDEVAVPVQNLIGQEGQGFRYLMFNFNHERFVIAAGTTASSRLCYEEAIKYSLKRKTFGKRLIEHQIIRFKLAEMARMIESLQDNLERCAYQFAMGIPDAKLGGQCALLKVQASKTFEYCAREAAQVFGGSAVVREGQGAVVERLYREVRAVAIPGGSEEILLDFAIRQAVSRL